MKQIKLTKDGIYDLTIKNKLFIKGDAWECLYSIREVQHDKVVILQEGKTHNDILYIAEKYDLELFVLDKEKEPEYWL